MPNCFLNQSVNQSKAATSRSATFVGQTERHIFRSVERFGLVGWDDWFELMRDVFAVLLLAADLLQFSYEFGGFEIVLAA